MKCPDCGSENIDTNTYRGTTYIYCMECGYDEREELDSDTTQRTSQKAKQTYTPYHTGGGKRITPSK